MKTYSIKDLIQSIDRYKLYTIMYGFDDLTDYISLLQAQNIQVLNVGKELSAFIDKLEDFSYLNIDVYDHFMKLLNSHKSRIDDTGNEVVAIYNLGILFEPRLELNASMLLKDFSKSTALIIIWENQSDIQGRLNGPTQQKSVFLDFLETQAKKLQHEI